MRKMKCKECKQEIEIKYEPYVMYIHNPYHGICFLKNHDFKT